MNYSFWEKHFIESSTDITIIGAGIVGLSTAISIKEANPSLSVKILERSSSPNGASTKNAGFSCFGSVSELLDDISNIGEEACMEIVKMRWNGLNKLVKRVSKEHLEFQDVGGTELFSREHTESLEYCGNQIPYLNELMANHLGIKDCYQLQNNTTLSTFHNQSIFNAYEGIINPVSMMNRLFQIAIQKDIIIHYGHEIKEMNVIQHTLQTTSELTIQYKKLIICTNGFTKRLLPDIELSPARNQVLITSPLPNISLRSGYHFDKGYIYFRQYQDRILLGGGRNLDIVGETTDLFGHTDIIQDYLIEMLNSIYPGASEHIDSWWSGIMGVGQSKKPLTDWIDDDILIGVRLGGMGVAIGSSLGETLAELIIQRS